MPVLHFNHSKEYHLSHYCQSSSFSSARSCPHLMENVSRHTRKVTICFITGRHFSNLNIVINRWMLDANYVNVNEVDIKSTLEVHTYVCLCINMHMLLCIYMRIWYSQWWLKHDGFQENRDCCTLYITNPLCL